jgi:quercetin dioxygenase-like cupin family protein
MKIALPMLIAAVAVAGVAFTTPADTMDRHTSVSPQDIKWGPAPAMLPPGAEAAVLFGDPSKDGLFVLRLKFPAGYSVAPHTHPVDEVVTVISGTFSVGMGETADQRKAQPLPAGSFHALPRGMAHYVFMEEETVIYKSAPKVHGDSPTSTRRTTRSRSRSEIEEHRHLRSSGPASARRA